MDREYYLVLAKVRLDRAKIENAEYIVTKIDAYVTTISGK